MRQLDHSYRYNIELQSNGASFDVVLGSMGMTKADYEKELETQAETYVKTQLVFEAIAAKENMTSTDADIQAYVDKVLESASEAASEGVDVSLDSYKKQYEEYYGNAITFDTFLKTSCTYEKVMAFISGNVKIKE